MNAGEAPLTSLPGGTITSPAGFRAGATSAGIRDGTPSRLDLALLYSENPCAAAGMYTQNTFRGAPVVLTKQHLANGRAQAIVANSGISNSLSGEDGMRHAEEMSRLAAGQLNVQPEDVVVASTGVTGWRLPIERIRDHLPEVELRDDGGADFARAIMTTDTFPKETAVQFEWNGVTYTVGGVAKGSGMIHPNMATMFAFMATDVAVDPSTVRSVLRETVGCSFNMLIIDGDTSPSDTVVLLANGAAGGETIDESHGALPFFSSAVRHVAIDLTRKLARDGEGAGKLIEVRIDGARSIEDARRAAKAIGGSALVKSAVFGNDPNWGRIVVALGYSGADTEETRTSVDIQGVEVYHHGDAVLFDSAALSEKLAQEEVRIRVDLGLGDSDATAWGCDLTPEYVRINSEYTT